MPGATVVLSAHEDSVKVTVDARTELLSQLLPKGLTPQQVCEQYFLACQQNNAELFLATLHLDACNNTKHSGPFAQFEWELGRNRVEKYKATWKFLNESHPVLEGSDLLVTLTYQVLLGDVPGYNAGDTLGPDVRLILKREGGERGEWRVLKGSF